VVRLERTQRTDRQQPAFRSSGEELHALRREPPDVENLHVLRQRPFPGEVEISLQDLRDVDGGRVVEAMSKSVIEVMPSGAWVESNSGASRQTSSEAATCSARGRGYG
jgi:hypothetical protein